MAYTNYLIKINGTILPNSVLVVPSYRAIDVPIEIQNYYDETYTKHIDQADAKDVLIVFGIRQLKSDAYADVVAMFSGQLNVEYFDAKTNSYKSGNFKATSQLNGSIWRIINGTVWMNAEEITLEKVG